MTIGKIIKKGKYCRERLKSPKKFEKGSFRTKEINPETKIIVACPRHEYDVKTKRCKVSTQTQAILKKPVNNICQKR